MTGHVDGARSRGRITRAGESVEQVRWRRIVEEFRRGAVGEQEFCRTHRIGKCALRWWMERLAVMDVHRSAPSTTIVSAASGAAVSVPERSLAVAKASRLATDVRARATRGPGDAGTIVQAEPNRPVRGAAKWEPLIRECKGSGLTSAEYAKRKGLNIRSFRWWRWQLGRRARPPTNVPQVRTHGSGHESPLFLPVIVRESPTPREPVPISRVHPPLEVVLAGDRRVLVHGDFDGPLLAKLVKALEASA